MKCYRFFICLSLPAILSVSAMGQTATVVLPTSLSAPVNSPFAVSVMVTTSENIGLGQFIVDYNATLVSFVSAVIGPDAPGFSVSLVNPALPFPPTTPGATDNVLIQISGGGANSFTGTGKTVAILNFQSLATVDVSPLAFDRGTSRTFLTTTTLADINGSNITFVDGQVTVPVESFSSDEGLPRFLALSQNYPNPFNPETDIRYDLPKASRVTLNIYNVAGQLVRTLVDGAMMPGAYVVRWNGSDDRGKRVAGGVYFYSLKTENFAQQKKMIFLP